MKNNGTKIFLFDFDGTLVTEDMLDCVCDIVGKKQESIDINKKVINGEVTGLEPLCSRINFLKGVSYNQIKEKINSNNYLQNGAIQLFDELNKRGFITVLSSGNILPILKYYKELLNINYIFGSQPKMENDIIQGITINDFEGDDFKYNSCLEIINKYNAKKENIFAVGDSYVDIGILSLAGHSFAINPKGGIEKEVDYTINSLTEIIKYLD